MNNLLVLYIPGFFKGYLKVGHFATLQSHCNVANLNKHYCDTITLFCNNIYNPHSALYYYQNLDNGIYTQN